MKKRTITISYLVYIFLMFVIFFLPIHWGRGIVLILILSFAHILLVGFLARKRKFLLFLFLLLTVLIFDSLVTYSFCMGKISYSSAVMLDSAREGVRLEKALKVRAAIRKYKKAIRVFSPDATNCYEYKGRCHFLLGEVEQALGDYAAKAESAKLQYSGRDNPAKLSLRIIQLLKDGKHEEAIVYCDEMIGLIDSLWDKYIILAGNEDEKEYLSGSSEGYVQKYFALTKLGRQEEADLLLSEYKTIYERDVLQGE